MDSFNYENGRLFAEAGSGKSSEDFKLSSSEIERKLGVAARK